MELTGREVHALVEALQPACEGKIQKVYGTDRYPIVLDLYARDLPYRYLYVDPPSMMFMHTVKVEMPPRPRGIAQRVRGQLQGMRIAAIEQYERDRIVIVRLEGRASMSLIIELFAKGNVIVLDEQGVIRNVLVKESFGSRDVRPGAHYAFPPGPKFSLDSFEFDPERHLVSQIASAGFGGHTAERILSRFDIDVSSATIADIEDIESLRRALLEEWDAKTFSFDGSRIVSDPDGVGILELLASRKLESATGSDEGKAKVKKRSARAVEIQSARVEELSERRSHDLRKGEVLFERYPLVEKALAFAREYREKHGSLDGLDERWPDEFPVLVSVSGTRIVLDFESFI